MSRAKKSQQLILDSGWQIDREYIVTVSAQNWKNKALKNFYYLTFFLCVNDCWLNASILKLEKYVPLVSI